MINLCETCKHCEWDCEESGWFPENCKLGYPEGSVENAFGDITECPEYKAVEVENPFESELAYLDRIGFKEWEVKG